MKKEIERSDELIGPIFMEKIADWRPHPDKMYVFWNAAMYGVPRFRGNPFAKRAELMANMFLYRLQLLNGTNDNVIV